MLHPSSGSGFNDEMLTDVTSPLSLHFMQFMQNTLKSHIYISDHDTKLNMYIHRKVYNLHEIISVT
jgi:hypothetical protein